MHNMSFVNALSLFQHNQTEKNRNFERPKMLNFYCQTIVIRVGGVCRYLERDVNLSIPNCQLISNRSMMNLQS